jgi:TolB protein
MTNSDRLLLTVGLLLACGFLLLMAIFAPRLIRLMGAVRRPAPDMVGTFRALVPSGSPPPTVATPPSPGSAPSVFSTSIPSPAGGGGGPGGHIVWTCQIFKDMGSEQICIMNPDGSGYRRLTTEDGIRHYYPSLAPDGRSVVYSQFREVNVFEIYEMDLATGKARRLTDRLGVSNAPEISPDGKRIVFTCWTVESNQDQVWIMSRDGGNPHPLFTGDGWDPTWSPDGMKILFASDRDGTVQLYTGNLDGSGVQRITNLPGLRGRSDWSSQNLIATYSGEAWSRSILVMNADGSNAHEISPPHGNSQGPSFSPDGEWIAFTGYYDHFKDIQGCEIYIVRIDGSDLSRLTNNDYCDYQPRWGP